MSQGPSPTLSKTSILAESSGLAGCVIPRATKIALMLVMTVAGLLLILGLPKMLAARPLWSIPAP
jgi:hypothetical protein